MSLSPTIRFIIPQFQNEWKSPWRLEQERRRAEEKAAAKALARVSSVVMKPVTPPKVKIAPTLRYCSQCPKRISSWNRLSICNRCYKSQWQAAQRAKKRTA